VRQDMAARALPSRWGRRTHPNSMHFWVDLPKGLRAADAVRKATDTGVRVTAGEAFSVASSPNAVRLALGRPLLREDLANALKRLVTAWT